MKTVLLAPYSTVGGGGLAWHTRKLVEYLSRRSDVELHLITVGHKCQSHQANHLAIHAVEETAPYPFSIPGLIQSLRSKVLEINPDIVHAEGSFAPYSTAGALLRHRYPTLLTVLGVVRREIKSYTGIYRISGTLLHKTNERYVVAKIPHIIVQSRNIENLLSNMTNSKIYVVPEGIEFEKVHNTPPCDLNEKPDIFLAVRLHKVKGVDLLIRALPTVIESIPNLKVHIAGTGEEEQNLKNLVGHLGLENNVKFLGYISDETEVNQHYKACKVVVVPSRWDVEPFAPLIAAALGKPIVVSDMCNSSVVDDGKTGCVYKSEDIGELSRKMVMLLTNQQMSNTMGQAAIKKAKEYDWSKIIERKVEIYKEVIADFCDQKRKDKVIEDNRL